MSKLVFFVSLLFLSGCIVEDNIFFDNESAMRYRDCYNQSLNTSPYFFMELQTDCYRAVVDNGECNKGTYTYLGCKSLLDNIYSCNDDHKLRKAYREECMIQ
jgi:hypothetical protein